MESSGAADGKSVGRHFAGTFGDRGKEVEAENGTAMVKDDMAYIFPAPGVLIIGEPKLVLRAANLPADAAIPPNLKKTLDHTRGNALLWVAANSKSILDTDSLADWH